MWRQPSPFNYQVLVYLYKFGPYPSYHPWVVRCWWNRSNIVILAVLSRENVIYQDFSAFLSPIISVIISSRILSQHRRKKKTSFRVPSASFKTFEWTCTPWSCPGRSWASPSSSRVKTEEKKQDMEATVTGVRTFGHQQSVLLLKFWRKGRIKKESQAFAHPILYVSSQV